MSDLMQGLPIHDQMCGLSFVWFIFMVLYTQKMQMQEEAGLDLMGIFRSHVFS